MTNPCETCHHVTVRPGLNIVRDDQPPYFFLECDHLLTWLEPRVQGVPYVRRAGNGMCECGRWWEAQR